MPFGIIRDDITNVHADAIVNSANPEPRIGSGTDSAIYVAAGEEQLLAERQKIGDIAPGQAVSTPAFALHAKYIIHTVGPMWIDGEHHERETLRACYTNSLALATKLGCRSIAFPLIASGVYRFPKAEALRIALDAIYAFLLHHDMLVTLVIFDRAAVQLSRKLVQDIDEYIDDHAAEMLREHEFQNYRYRRGRLRAGAQNYNNVWRHDEGGTLPEAVADLRSPRSASEAPAVREHTFPDVSGKSLDEVFRYEEDTFQQRLLKLIEEKGTKNSVFYHKANLDRKLFSAIKKNTNYQPKKVTAVACAIGLELDMPTTQDLLSRAGFTLSPSNKFDLIISYFITNKKYNIMDINSVLFDYDQPLIGY